MSSESDSSDDNIETKTASINKKEAAEQSSDVSDDDDEDRNKIRTELSTMSFEDLMKLKEKLGSKVYNETVFGTTSKQIKKKNLKTNFKRENKNRPREEGVKRPVPFLGKFKSKKSSTIIERRDPRFDPKCGEFDSKKFAENFNFVSEIKEKELIELQKQLKTSEDPKQQKKIKYLIQRMNNQKTEKEKRKIKAEVLAEEQTEIKKAKSEFKKPYYVSDRERKARELVKQFEQLKDTGKLDKHLEKRRKKVASRDRKKFNFDSQNE